MFFEVILQVVEGLDVGVHTLGLRVGNEDHSIHTAENQFAAGIIEDLPWNCVEMEAGLKAANGAQVERQEVEEERSIGLGGQRDHLSLLLLVGFVKNVLQIR